MKIALIGFNMEGRSSYEYFLARGHDLTIHDQNDTIIVPVGAKSVLGERYLNGLNTYDLVVRTAGLPPRLLFEVCPELDPKKVTTQINEFFKASPTSNIIGVTGTKGKGTTSSLIHQMLEAAGLDVHLAGNIGVPALSILDDINAESWVVLELSSFQLVDLRYSPHIGVCLMVVAEHLNWHANMEDYVAAKAQLFRNQTPTDIAIYYGKNETSKNIATAGKGVTLPYFDPPGASVIDNQITIDNSALCATDELKLLGAHNWQNACAAVTATWQVTNDVKAIKSVLTSFSGLEHRLELVRTFEGIQYYDDSFGTTTETAIVAIAALPLPKILILGGSDKGADYTDLALAVHSGNVKQVLLIGEQAGRIQEALEAVGYHDFLPGGDTMAAIVKSARELADSGEVILLSTGCASFGMFANYKDRGAQFKTAVQGLA